MSDSQSLTLYTMYVFVCAERGYAGVYAPKPASACLKVSENSDGCALFVKRDKIRILSTEVSKQAWMLLVSWMAL